MAACSGRAIEVFTEAVQLPAEERGAFLERTCVDDEGLRMKIGIRQSDVGQKSHCRIVP
jgi:hypothetical protein